MASEKLSFGQAIDKIIEALQGLDEKTRANAIAAACAQMGLESPVIEKKTPPSGSGSAPDTPPAGKPPKDIRTLRVEKAPSSAIEMACIVAYYLLHNAPERKETVTVKDMSKYFVQGNFPLPKQIESLLVHGKEAGYFDSAERGAYRLNAVGHNLVAHTLPRKAKS
jgi:hypothetical protein